MTNPTHMLNFKNEYFEVLEYYGRDKKYNAHAWKCKCRCGNIVVLRTSVVKLAQTKSCGCTRKNPFVKGHPYGKRFQPTHGLSKHPLFRVWSHIIERCHGSHHHSKSYRYYQGKGIKVCDEWRNDFTKFYDWAIAHNWKKGLTIDRLDSNGNYEPLNCEFISKSENSKRMALCNPVYGSFNGNSVLTDEKVRDIRQRLTSGDNATHIARYYGVHRKTIYNIRDNKYWTKLI